jgi:HAD superfamily hydrolase (TIGR01549 family)
MKAQALTVASLAGRRIRGLIFDVDGTLTHQGAIDFALMRARIGAPPGSDMITFVDAVPDAVKREELRRILEEEELLGLERGMVRADAMATLDLLHGTGIRLGVVTRNNPNILAKTMEKLGRAHLFSPMLSRAFVPVKPDPAPALHILREWALPACEVLFVGDAPDDMACGRGAGCDTVLIGEPDHHLFEKALPSASFTIRHLADLSIVAEASMT